MAPDDPSPRRLPPNADQISHNPGLGHQNLRGSQAKVYFLSRDNPRTYRNAPVVQTYLGDSSNRGAFVGSKPWE